MTKGLIFALIILSAVIGCQPDNEPVVGPGVVRLIGTWQLADSTLKYAVTLKLAVDPNNPPVDVTPFLVSGESAVNTYNGLLSAAADGMMVVYRLGHTEKAGPADAMQAEQTYLTRLKAVVRYEVTPQQQLLLRYGSDKPGFLVFNPVK